MGVRFNSGNICKVLIKAPGTCEIVPFQMCINSKQWEWTRNLGSLAVNHGILLPLKVSTPHPCKSIKRSLSA